MASAGALGAGLSWNFGGKIAWGQIPWEDTLESVRLDETEDLGLSPMHQLGKGIHNEYPRIVFDQEDRLWATWVSQRYDGEQVYLTWFSNGKWGEEIKISQSAGYATHPAILSLHDEVIVFWTEKHDANWRVFMRRVVTGKPGAIEMVSPEEGIHWRPALATDGRRQIWAVWEQKVGTNFEVVARVLNTGTDTPLMKISRAPGKDCCRPSVAMDRRGRAWIAWDQMDSPGGTNIYFCSADTAAAGESIQVTHHPAADLAPALAFDSDDLLWIAWHSNRAGDARWDIPRWFQVRCYDRGRFFEPVSEPTSKNLTKEGSDQSFEFVRLCCSPDGKVVVTGRPSHNFCIQYYHGDSWSPLYRLPDDGWGGRGQYLSGAFDNKGDFWVIRRDLRANVLQQITGMTLPKSAPKLKRVDILERTPRTLVNIQRRPRPWEAVASSEGDEQLNFYYGDLHAHTWMSDGVGDVDEFHFTMRDYYEDDFAALTDHDTFVGNSILPSEWELMKTIAEHFNQTGRFVTIFGQEWTTARIPTGFGHKNIYHIRPDMPLLDHTQEDYRTAPKLLARCRELGAIAIPHHIGWTGSDWENADEIAQPLVEIISNHGCFEYMGNRPIAHRGGIRGSFVQDGLARGLKFGIVGGSDSHGLIWHHRVGYKRDCRRTGLTAILAADLSRESLFDALKKRRTFATTGIKPRVDFRINGHVMGEAIETSESPTIEVAIAAQQPIHYITVVKNNQNWYENGGDGYRTRFTMVDREVEPGESFYYLRVHFEGDEMAWTSPIWVNYTA